MAVIAFPAVLFLVLSGPRQIRRQAAMALPTSPSLLEGATDWLAENQIQSLSERF
jgi:hypothetical protein